jgi:hypothetical protein
MEEVKEMFKDLEEKTVAALEKQVDLLTEDRFGMGTDEALSKIVALTALLNVIRDKY